MWKEQRLYAPAPFATIGAIPHGYNSLHDTPEPPVLSTKALLAISGGASAAASVLRSIRRAGRWRARQARGLSEQGGGVPTAACWGGLHIPLRSHRDLSSSVGRAELCLPNVAMRLRKQKTTRLSELLRGEELEGKQQSTWPRPRPRIESRIPTDAGQLRCRTD